MKLLISCLLAAFLFFSCKKQDATDNGNNNTPPDNTVKKGTVTGKVVTPNNKSVVKNPTVFIPDGGTIYSSF